MSDPPAVPNNTPVSRGTETVEKSTIGSIGSDEIIESTSSSFPFGNTNEIDHVMVNLEEYIERQKRRRESNSFQVSGLLCANLKQEVLRYLEEYVKSQEYADYLKLKADVDRRIRESEEMIRRMQDADNRKMRSGFNNVSATALKAHHLETQMNRFLIDSSNAVIVKNQLESIKTIKDKIAEVKTFCLCQNEEQEMQKKFREQAKIDDFIREYNIDTSKMISTTRLADVIKDVQKKMEMKEKLKKTRTTLIVNKLARESRQKKFYHQEKISHRSSAEKSTETKHMDPQLFLSEKEIPKPFRDTEICLDKGASGYLDGADNVSEKTEEPKNLSVIKVTTSKGEINKIKLNEYEKEKLGIEDSTIEIGNLSEARDFSKKFQDDKKEELRQKIEDASNKHCFWTPQKLIISGFKTGIIYKKKLVFRTIPSYPARLKFLKVDCVNPEHRLNFDVEPKNVRLILPGIPLEVTVKFSPQEDTETVDATMVFSTHYSSTSSELRVQVECLPSSSDVTITPRKISFGSVPIWRITKSLRTLTRFLNISCSGKYDHRIVIKRKFDEPARSEDSDASNTSLQQDVLNVLDEILADVTCPFRLNYNYLTINKSMGDQKVEFSLYGVESPGFYIQEYIVDIYKIHDGQFEHKGTETVFAELVVTECFIELFPICVDFGVCTFETPYQMAFSLKNKSKEVQWFSLSIPGSVRDFVSLNDNKTFVKAEGTKTIDLRFLPSYDLRIVKNRYFDRDTSIFHFPIQILLHNKKYLDLPPMTEPVYAILNDSADLRLDPTDNGHYTVSEGMIYLNIGECTTNEVVRTKIVLRNATFSTQYYIFKDLPNYITIMPNYGVGEIHSFEDVDLEFYIHPQISDFRTQGYGDSFVCKSKIEVSTADDMAKYKERPDVNRFIRMLKTMWCELKVPTDYELLEDIFEANMRIRRKIVLETCSSIVEDIILNAENILYEPEIKLTETTLVTDTQNSSTVLAHIDDSDLVVIKAHHHHRKSSHHQHHKSKSKKEKEKKKRGHSETKSSLRIESKTETEEEEWPSLLLKKGVPKFVRNEPEDFVEINDISRFLSKELYLRALFVKPMYEFSYNYIELPATPALSYSTMLTELRPLEGDEANCYCCYKSNSHNAKCKATFQISGSTKEIRIEPNYGVLTHGDSINLTLVATPLLKENDIDECALNVRRKKVHMQKLQSQHVSGSKTARSGKKKTGKARFSQKGENSKDEDTKENEVTPSDYAHAEMILLRYLEPHNINITFTCRIKYEIDDAPAHAPDTFCLQTTCRVIQPEFVHAHDSNRLDFEKIPIGCSKTKTITVENLRFRDVPIWVSFTKPKGCFSCANFDSTYLSCGKCMKIPFTFSPKREGNMKEFIEIRSDKTIYQFILMGEAVMPTIRIEPASKVIRFVAKRGKLHEISFDIINDSSVPITVSFEKVCELEDKISTPVVTGIGKKSKDGKKVEKENSDELTADEISALEHTFSKQTGQTYFHFSKDTRQITVPESSKARALMFFGDQAETYANLEVRPKKKPKQEPDSQKPDDTGKVFLAKFNVQIESSTFLKDFIIIGRFK